MCGGVFVCDVVKVIVYLKEVVVGVNVVGDFVFFIFCFEKFGGSVGEFIEK